MNLSEPFRRNLRFWSVHVPLCAAMSFATAVSVEFNRVQSVIGMLGGIVVFILLYAKVWSSAWFRRWVPEGSRREQALKYGAWTRSVISVLGLVAVGLHLALSPKGNNNPLLAIPMIVLFTPDFFSGFGVGLFTEWCIKSPLLRAIRVAVGGTDAHARYQNLAVGDVNSLLPTFCMTLMQGVLLSLYLLILSAAALGMMRLDRWRKARKTGAIGSQPVLT